MKKLFIWLLAAMIFQLGVYEYLDRFLLAPQASFSQQAVKGSQSSDPSVSYSFDRSYFVRTSPKGVKIFATQGKSLVKEIDLRTNESISYFSWLADRNLALVGTTYDGPGGTTVTLQPINPETDSEPVIPKIVGLAKGAKITQVASSTETNLIDILVNSGSTTAVYRTDANNNLRRMHMNTSHVGRIGNLKSTGALIYDSTSQKAVFMIDNTGRRGKISPAGESYALIGVDKDDHIYIGKLVDSNRVSSIMVGSANSFFSEYKKLNYTYPIDGIKVDIDGKILLS